MTSDKLSSRNEPAVAVNTQALAEAFCIWPLPKTVCADLCTTDSAYTFPRSGTNLLTVAEAKAMFEHLVEQGLLKADPGSTAGEVDPRTEAERAVVQASAELWNAFLKLPDVLDDDVADVRFHIHALQSIAAAIFVSRAHPTFFKFGDLSRRASK